MLRGAGGESRLKEAITSFLLLSKGSEKSKLTRCIKRREWEWVRELGKCHRQVTGQGGTHWMTVPFLRGRVSYLSHHELSRGPVSSLHRES